jgi:SAM-dependent methyltransferase
MVRQSGHYRKEYIRTFADRWDELVDWEGRAQSEGDFFIQTMHRHGVERIVDVATGTGFHSVRLLSAGFDVTSVDGSPEMLSRAFNNARQRGLVLRTCCADWRRLSQSLAERYDGCICLGNSFTHLFDEGDRRKALAEFYAILAYDGVLVIDQRNYDSILDDRFTSQHRFYYCGTNVVAEPEYVDDGLARFVYRFSDGAVFHLNMFPLRVDYLRRLLREAGFERVTTYGDFQECSCDEQPDFFIHVAEKVSHEDE